MAIETLLDLEAVSLEELVGRLKATEERFDRGKGKGGGGSSSGGIGKEIDGKLYFTEEQVIAHLVSRLNINADGSAARGKAPVGSSKRRGGRGRDKERGKETLSGPPKGGHGGEVDDDACRYCGKTGHWIRECRKKKRDEAAQAQVNLTQAEEESSSLFMAVVAPTEETIHGAHSVEQVFLNESKVVADIDDGNDREELKWYLDTGALNHMTGDASIFSELNRGVISSVQFGDRSLVEIIGRGTILFESKDSGHHAFHDVYHIP